MARGIQVSIVRLLLATLLGAAPAVAQIRVTDGPRDVDFEPLEARGSYVRIVHVQGATVDRVLRALRGPATGPLGFARTFVSETPVREQHVGDRTNALRMRAPGAPAIAGSNVSARFDANGMTATLSGGIVGGEFEITVMEDTPGADGRPRVRVTETGRFHILRQPPSSIFGIPRYLFANLTPMGWVMQALGGSAVSAAHIRFFELEKALEVRLTSGLPQYE